MDEIQLSKEDARMGLFFRAGVIRALAQAQALQDAENEWLAAMRDKYGVKPETHTLTEWADGFAKVEAVEVKAR